MGGNFLIDFKRLQYFLAVAEEGHITRAAKKLNIAQPPLSNQIKLLEKELGVQLLQKVGRNIQLTEAGYALQSRGEQIMTLVDHASEELKDIYNGETGSLSIGCVTSWGATLLPYQIANYSNQYPNIKFRICEGDNHRIIDLLTNGIIDIGIIASPFDSSIFNNIQLPQEPIFVAMTEKWNDNPTKTDITLDEIANKPIILLNHRQDRILSYFQSKNINANIICLHDDVRSMLSLTDTGLGVSIVPKAVTDFKAYNNIIYKKIVTPSITVSANVIWMKNRYLSTISERFLKMILEYK